MSRRLLLAAAALAVAPACELTYEPDVGGLVPGVQGVDGGGGEEDGGMMSEVGGPCADGDPRTNVSFGADVRPLMFRPMGGCGCHASSSTSGFSLGSYERLRRGGLNSGTDIVIPGEPCNSILWQKLGLAPPFGSRMPYNGPPYYTPEELAIIRDWIAEGARNN